ncbi:hypothetical protein V8C35DRAFT_63924 [Trichoderma chlorosporum]
MDNNNHLVWVDRYYNNSPLYPDHRTVLVYKLCVEAELFNAPDQESHAIWGNYLYPGRDYLLLTKHEFELLGFECSDPAAVELYLPLQFLVDFQRDQYNWDTGLKWKFPNGNIGYSMVGRSQQGHTLVAVSVQHPNTAPNRNAVQAIIEDRMCNWHNLDDPKICFRSVDKDVTLIIRPLEQNGVTADQVVNAFARVKSQMGCKTKYVCLQTKDDKILTNHCTLLSTSPFGFYETYISTNEIPTEIEKDRPFPQEDARKFLMERAEWPFTKALNTDYDPASIHEVNFEGFLKQVRYYAQQAAPIDPDKIEASAGKRGEAQSQQAAMGGLSATDLANEFNWNADPPQGLSKAEWLHIVAFSFGAMGSVGKFHLSQLSLNLIFGTAECNSVMLRYEGIWQVLYQYEAELRALSPEHHQTKPHGFIQPTVNNGLQVKPLNCPNAHPWLFDDIKLARELSEIFPWLCFALKYRINIDFSLLLQKDSEFSQTLDFFPFTRPFFTRGEALADRFLLDELFYERATYLHEKYHQ